MTFLHIGIGEKIHTSQSIIAEAEKRNLPFIFAKWSSLFFDNAKVYAGQEEIPLNDISGVFFDIPRFNILKKTPKEEISYNLENDLFIFLKILDEKKIFAPNAEFLLAFPYYNKFIQQYLFASKDIPSIDTLHLCDNSIKNVKSALEKSAFDYPIIVKESYGGMGSKVWKMVDESDLEKFIQNKRNSNLVFQKYVANDGDFRVVVVGGKSLGIMKRTAIAGEWKNNFALGGEIEQYEDAAMEIFAEGICKKLGIDNAGIDIIKSSAGKYLVIEINLFFCFEGFEKTHPHINVAGKIIDNLLQKK